MAQAADGMPLLAAPYVLIGLLVAFAIVVGLVVWLAGPEQEQEDE